MHFLLSQIDTYIILSKTQLHFKWYASSPQTHLFSASFMTLVCTERPEIGRCWGDSLGSMAALMLFNWQEPSCGIKDNSVGTVYLWCLFTSHSHSFFLPLSCRARLGAGMSARCMRSMEGKWDWFCWDLQSSGRDRCHCHQHQSQPHLTLTPGSNLCLETPWYPPLTTARGAILIAGCPWLWWASWAPFPPGVLDFPFSDL